MERIKSKGMCKFCSKYFSGTVMGQHIQTCRKRMAELREEADSFDIDHEVYLIKVSGGPLYWLFVEVNGSTTLEKLDVFLRNIWLECCGHLSQFMINGVSYDVQPDPDYPSKSMKVRIDDVLKPRLSFEYEYDFGTTTHLRLKVISSRLGVVGKSDVQLIARNEPYTYKYASCGKNAKNICSQCLGETEDTSFCDKCVKKHECGEEMALPVVNSPRMGMCGYTGY